MSMKNDVNNRDSELKGTEGYAADQDFRSMLLSRHIEAGL